MAQAATAHHLDRQQAARAGKFLLGQLCSVMFCLGGFAFFKTVVLEQFSNCCRLHSIFPLIKTRDLSRLHFETSFSRCQVGCTFFRDAGLDSRSLSVEGKVANSDKTLQLHDNRNQPSFAKKPALPRMGNKKPNRAPVCFKKQEQKTVLNHKTRIIQ